MSTSVSATTVFLVRHAAHDRLGRVLAGRMPGVHLGEAGRAEAASVAARLGRERIVAVYSSPLERARETAETVAQALGLPVLVSEALNEIDCGAWTGQSFDDLSLDERWQGWNRSRAAGQAPGGESMRAVQQRIAFALANWSEEHRGAAIVAVSHSDVIKALVCRVLDLSLDRHGSFEISPASVTTLVTWERGGKVLSLNEAPSHREGAFA